MLLKLQISQYQAALAVSAMYPQQNLRLSQVVMKIAKYLLDFTGMLMASKQWGYYSFSGGSDNRIVSLNFPMSFSSSCYAILINEASANTETQWINGLAVTAKTKSGFSFKIGFSQNSALHMIATGK